MLTEKGIINTLNEAVLNTNLESFFFLMLLYCLEKLMFVTQSIDGILNMSNKAPFKYEHQMVLFSKLYCYISISYSMFPTQFLYYKS